MRLPQRVLGCHKRWKSLSFCEMWNNPTLPLFLFDALTDKHWRAWNSTINLWIARKTFSNNLEQMQKQMFWGNMTLSHWLCFTWKFFMIWFHKILKSIFQTLTSCPRNICPEHWKKLPNLTAFLEICLYLKNNDSVEHVQKVLLIVLFIYFQGKIKFSHCIWSIWFIFILI